MSQTNGTTDKPITELREQLERYELQEQIAEHRFRTRLMEGLNDDYGRLVDMTDRWRDADGNYRTLGGQDERKRGSDPATGVIDLEQLRMIRDNCRIIAQRTTYGKGLVKNYVNFLIRTGFTYEAQPIGDNGQLAVETQSWLEQEFFPRNQWPQREQEWARRCFRDGETFVRSYEDAEDPTMTLTRFIEPEQVQNPPGASEEDGWTFGKRHQVQPRVDLETIEAFGVAWGDVDNPTEVEAVEAKEIYHHKRNVDLTIKRGIPDLYACSGYLDEAWQLFSNAGISAKIQAAYTFIVQHAKATQAGVSSFRAGTRTFQGQDATTGRNTNYERVRPGKRLDIPAGMEYVDHPMWTANTPQHIAVGQALLRGAAASVCMPEYMVSADSSNSNYASTLVSGGPIIIAAETEQNEYKQAFLAVIWKAIAKRWGKTVKEMQRLIKIDVKPPQVEIVDKLALGNVRQLETMNKARSPQDWSRELGLDPEKMLQEWEDFNERMGQGTPVEQPYQGFGEVGGCDECGDRDCRNYGKCGGPGGTPGPCPTGHNIKLPKNKRALNIDQANDAMKQMGFELNKTSSSYEPGKGTTYEVKTPSGETKRMHVDEIKKLVYSTQGKGDGDDDFSAPGAIKLSVPTRLQTVDYSCGAAAMQAVCEYFDVGTDSEAAFMRSLGTGPADGTNSDAMVELAERLGLDVLPGPLTAGEVMTHLQEGHPVIVHLGDGGGHYAVITGMDDKTVWMMNPATGEEHATLDEWEGRWAPERWGMVVSGKRKPAVESLSETVRSVLMEQEQRHAASMTELRTTLAAVAAVAAKPVVVNTSTNLPSLLGRRRVIERDEAGRAKAIVDESSIMIRKEIERDPETGLAKAIVDECGNRRVIERNERGLVKAVVEEQH